MAENVIDDVVKIVGTILNDPAKEYVTSHAFRLEGGWELWLQVELACALRQLGYTVTREQKIYLLKNPQGQELKNDLKIMVPNTPSEYVSVELKAQSDGQKATFTKTVFETDIDKVKYGFKDTIVATCGIIVVNNPATIAEFDQNFMGLHTGKQRSMSRLPTEGKFGPNVIYSWALDIKPDSGKPFVTLDSPEVFFKWVGKEPDLFEYKS